MNTEDRSSLVDRLDALGVWSVERPSPRFTDGVLNSATGPAPTRRWSTRRIGIASACAAALAVTAVAFAIGRSAPDHGELHADRRRTLEIEDRAIVVAEAGTHLAWHSDAASIRVVQDTGHAFYRVEDGGDFDVTTPAGTVRVTGTCFTVEIEDMNDNRRSWLGGTALGSALAAAVVVTVYEGDVVLANDEGAVAVAAGERARAREGELPTLGDEGDDAPQTVAALRAENRAHERELARLRQELAARTSSAPTGEDDAEASHDDETPPGPALPDPLLATIDEGFSYFEPTAEALEKMADCGVVAWDQPPVWDADAGFDADWRDAVDLGPEESEVVDAALGDFRERSLEQLRAFYVELGGDAESVATFTASELLELVYARLPREELVATREAIAREKAGREDPPEHGSVADRFMRWEARLGDAFEDELGRRLDPARAHELRAADEGWGNKRLTYTNLCIEM